MRSATTPIRVALARALVVGVAAGLLLAVLPMGIWLARTRSRVAYLGLWTNRHVMRYALATAFEFAAWHALIGLVVGLSVWWASKASSGRWRRFALGVAALWALLLAASVVAAPASWRLVPVARGLPVAALVAIWITVAGLLARAAGLAPLRVAAFGVSAWLLVLWPEPRLRLPPATPVNPPDIYMIGVDALGRDGLDSVVALVRRRDADALAGGRYVRRVVSQSPVSRIALLGLVAGRSPADIGETQFVSWRDAASVEAALAPALPDTLRRLGYRTVFASDVAASAYFGGRWFDTIIAEATGWKFAIRSALNQGLPLPQLLVGRWRGPGLGTAFGDHSPRKLWRDTFRAARSSPRRPLFALAHTVVLHTPLNIAPAEFPGPAALLRIKPAAFLPVESEQDAERRERAGGRDLPSHHDLYDLRRRAVIEETADLLSELQRRGYRRHAFLVLFTDHGEHFDRVLGGRSVTSGHHGLSLEPASVTVSLLLLPPTRSADVAPLEVDSSTTASLYDVPGLVLGRLHTGQWPALTPARLFRLRAGVNVGGAERAPNGPSARSVPTELLARSAVFRPDGAFLVSPQTVAAMDEASTVGWMQNDGMVVLTPLEDGWVRMRSFAGSHLRGDTLLAAATAESAAALVLRALTPPPGAAESVSRAPRATAPQGVRPSRQSSAATSRAP